MYLYVVLLTRSDAQSMLPALRRHSRASGSPQVRARPFYTHALLTRIHEVCGHVHLACWQSHILSRAYRTHTGARNIDISKWDIPWDKFATGTKETDKMKRSSRSRSKTSNTHAAQAPAT